MVKKNFKILFAGGGTGGHLFSGIAVAEEVREHYPEAQVLFVGTPFGMEKEIIPKHNFSIEYIHASPLKGSGIWFKVKGLARLPRAYRQAKNILKKFRPDIVIGIGGYASGPMTLAAHFHKIFTAIIEQNSYPGLTNRILGRFVNRVFISFNKAKEFFDPQKTIFSGNPVRSMKHEGGNPHSGRFTVFVLGGSQGAHALNVALMEALPLLKEESPRLHFIHQTGKNDFLEVQDAYRRGGFSAEVFPFTDDLGSFYHRADLALCRAGAGTITELRTQGLPSLLVPYPYATDDHQRHNAQELVDQGAAQLILNKDLTGKVVTKKITHYLARPEQLKEMSQKTAQQAKPQAAQEVLNHCLISIS